MHYVLASMLVYKGTFPIAVKTLNAHVRQKVLCFGFGGPFCSVVVVTMLGMLLSVRGNRETSAFLCELKFQVTVCLTVM